jgi:boron transporter
MVSPGHGIASVPIPGAGGNPTPSLKKGSHRRPGADSDAVAGDANDPGFDDDDDDVSARQGSGRGSGTGGGPWWRIHLFRGMINDVRRRAPYYASDWTDAWDYRVVPATVYMYFAK